MMGSELACGVRVQHPQDVVGAGCRAKEKQQPCALQIRDMRNPVQEDLVFSGDVTQLRIDELTVRAASPTLSCLAGQHRMKLVSVAARSNSLDARKCWRMYSTSLLRHALTSASRASNAASSNHACVSSETDLCTTKKMLCRTASFLQQQRAERRARERFSPRVQQITLR